MDVLKDVRATETMGQYREDLAFLSVHLAGGITVQYTVYRSFASWTDSPVHGVKGRFLDKYMP